jgi:hypothetical protein
VLGKAWDNQYIGDHHSLMLKNICSLSRKEYYGNQISIIQSSGYGKSRMVHEQSKLVFTIPFNIRPAPDDRGVQFFPRSQRVVHDVVSDLAFPPADNTIRNCLTHVLDLDGVTKRYLKFFMFLFKAIREELSKTRQRFPDSCALANWWSAHLIDIREQLYSRVAEETEKDFSIDVRVEQCRGNESHDSCRKASEAR